MQPGITFSADSPDEARVASFCQTAAYTGWLLQLEKEEIVIWHCGSPSPCTNCVWPDGGHWYIVEIVNTGGNYTAY